jgi:hypothetical protein
MEKMYPLGDKQGRDKRLYHPEYARELELENARLTGANAALALNLAAAQAYIREMGPLAEFHKRRTLEELTK